MTVHELANQLIAIKPELQSKEVKVFAQNGLLFTPRITFQCEDPATLNKTKENVKCIILSW